MSNGHANPPAVPPATPPKKSYKGCIIAAAIVATIAILGIGGCAALGLFAVNVFKNQAEDALNANPVIQEHLGSVEKLNTDLMATGTHEDDETFIFSVTGTKGSGKVTVQLITVDAHTEKIGSGTLVMSSGESYNLVPNESEEDGEP